MVLLNNTSNTQWPLFKILLYMKFPMMLLVCSIFQANAEIAAQEVDVTVRNAPLSRVFRMLKQQTGYDFLYVSADLEGAKPISINVKRAPFLDVLAACFDEQPLVYEIRNTAVLIRRKPGLKKPPGVSEAQDSEIRGTVSAEDGRRLSGVTVTVKSTAEATTTDSGGNFRIVVPPGVQQLVFTNIGYETVEQEVRSSEVVTIFMKMLISDLDEVVVIGMDNRQTKRSVTGAIATIKTRELKQSPVANLSNALAGRLPGLITVQTSGQPGDDGSALFIRGIGTYGNSAPLVVIDGLPRAQADFNQLDANEIESVTILKDAASSSLYGIQGANGVVVVTTRRGAANRKPEINFTAQQAVQQPIRLPRMMDTYQQALYFKELDQNVGLPVRYTDEVLEIVRTGSDPYQYPNVNWFNEVLKDQSLQNQYNLNISGSANNNIRYFISGSYIKQGTLLRHDDLFSENYGVNSKFDRYNFRSNLDMDATSRLNIRIDLAGRLENRTGPGPGFGAIFTDITGRSPAAQPVFNQDGTLGAGSALEIPYHKNPYGLITQSGYYTGYTNVMYGTLAAKHELDFIAKGLNAQLYFSFENNNNRTTYRTQDFDSYWYRGENTQGTPVYQQIGIASRLATSGTSFIQRYNYLDFRLNYDTTFAAHTISAQLLANRTLRVVNDELPYAYQGVSAHMTYNYLNKYFLELNLGYNGSENFPPDRRYGFFPAVSAGWIISDESFASGSDWLHFLKLRGSYGVVGNDKIGGQRWLYISDYAPGGGTFFGASPVAVPGYNENRVGNNLVTWERSLKSNIGFDLALWRNNVIQVSFDVFREKRTNILTPPGDVPDFVAIAGLAPRNSGVVLNRGYEGEVRFNKTFGELNVFTNVQLTYARNEVLENDQPTPAFPYQDLRGYEVGYMLGYRAAGFFKDINDIAGSPDQNFSSNVIPGDIKYHDTNRDGVIDAFDRVPIQVQNVPRYVGGLSLGFSYRGFDMSILGNGATGGTAYMYTYPGSLINLERWTPERMDNARVPVANSTNNNTLTSDLFVQQVNYLKIRNAEVGYVIPGRLLNPFKVTYARVYVNGQNLAVWDTLWLKDRDPESAGGAMINYPLQRIFNIGINVRF